MVIMQLGLCGYMLKMDSFFLYQLPDIVAVVLNVPVSVGDDGVLYHFNGCFVVFSD